ncbi:MAG: GSCFA domain-containing protein, partial [Bacteroidetes bacterium]|nr:GSCFA domain-containing protein [Bacteroidota bacterium]
IGSCFSENIGLKFRDYKFSININPFGQQYNPYSIAVAIHRLLEAKPYTESELVHHDELYHSFDHHGSFSKSTVDDTLQYINGNLQQASTDLKNATLLFLTFGTSHVFTLKESGAYVSNCHKLSGTYFERKVLKPQEIISALRNAIDALRAINPSIKIVATVSPVRYFAFGHYENSVSKAHLFTAINQLQEIYNDLYYFPAYELVMDDLRDYRFFAEDMLHPNYQATNYVWETLSNTMLDKKTSGMMKEIDEILLAARHRPRNPNSDAHRKFVQKYITKIDEMQTKGLSFDKELEILKKQL